MNSPSKMGNIEIQNECHIFHLFHKYFSDLKQITIYSHILKNQIVKIKKAFMMNQKDQKVCRILLLKSIF